MVRWGDLLPQISQYVHGVYLLDSWPASSQVAGHPSIYVLGGHHHWFNVLGMHNL